MENKSFTVTDDLLASSGQRFLNFCIDLLIQYILWLSIGAGLVILGEISNNYAFSERMEAFTLGEQILSGAVFVFFYYCFMEIYFSRTPAKFFTKTKVVMTDGSKPNVKAILLRTICRFIPLEAFTFLGTDPRGWHDIFSKTYVVKRPQFDKKKHVVDLYDAS